MFEEVTIGIAIFVAGAFVRELVDYLRRKKK